MKPDWDQQQKEAKLIVFMILSLVFIFGFYCGKAAADEWTATPSVNLVSHTSDILRGCPFACGESEPTEDAFMGGFIFTSPNRKWQFEILHGFKCLDCVLGEGEIETGTKLHIRWLPLGEHRWSLGRK